MDIASLTADGIAAVRQYQSAYGKSAVQLFLAGSKTIPSSNWRCFNKVSITQGEFRCHYAAGPLGVIHEQIYNCDNNPKNKWKGYCILPKPDAIIHCNKDPHCGGYEETMDIASLTADGIAAVRQYQSAYGKSAVQLFLAGSKTIPSSNWRCFNKVSITQGEFRCHYAAGPLGVIHEQIYNCDNNPKNKWKGYCILPKPDAIIHCNKDPHCGGYEETMDIASLTADGIAAVRQYQSAYGKSAVQLFLAGSKTIPSSNWRCFNKVYSEPHAAHKHNHKANGIDEQC
ncbi:unnamed protein product [Rotaria socialis]